MVRPEKVKQFPPCSLEYNIGALLHYATVQQLKAIMLWKPKLAQVERPHRKVLRKTGEKCPPAFSCFSPPLPEPQSLSNSNNLEHSKLEMPS